MPGLEVMVCEKTMRQGSLRDKDHTRQRLYETRQRSRWDRDKDQYETRIIQGLRQR